MSGLFQIFQDNRNRVSWSLHPSTPPHLDFLQHQLSLTKPTLLPVKSKDLELVRIRKLFNLSASRCRNKIHKAIQELYSWEKSLFKTYITLSHSLFFPEASFDTDNRNKTIEFSSNKYFGFEHLPVAVFVSFLWLHMSPLALQLSHRTG